MLDISSVPPVYFIATALLALLFSAIAVVSLRQRQAREIRAYQLRIDEHSVSSRERDERHIQALHQADLELARARTELSVKTQQITELNKEIAHLISYKEQYIQMQTRLEEQQLYQAQEKRLIEETKNHLFKEFELAANKLFESKQQQFSSASKTNIEAILKPFREQLQGFHQRVEDVYHKENSQRNQLVGQIAELQKQAQQISADANNLATALKGDNKTQGNWGEIILERLLEQSGLQKGREYETQRVHTDESGKRFKPDVIVHLPEGKDIVIDSKVSLLDYEHYCREENKEEKEAALQRHVSSLRTHIRGMSLKQYEQLQGVRTLDFVFIFIPVEAAYVAAIQSLPALFKEAYDKNIVLVSPSSLMVALRTVEMLWRYEKQNNNAEAIAQSAGRLYDQFVLFVSALEDIGTNLDRATKAYDIACKRLSEGRGNLLRRVDDLKALGARASRTLPEKYKLEESDEQLLDSEEQSGAQAEKEERIVDLFSSGNDENDEEK